MNTLKKKTLLFAISKTIDSTLKASSSRSTVLSDKRSDCFFLSQYKISMAKTAQNTKATRITSTHWYSRRPSYVKFAKFVKKRMSIYQQTLKTTEIYI